MTTKITDDFVYTIEFRIDKLEKFNLDRILLLISEFPTAQYKELSKLPKTPEQKTSI